ncbi:SIMPL domain-containing protein [Devosia pacifica]|uniref:SIMPL domain-containing protein n=1 Tax=Devosia pacifica TaxID=1335967 RepID=A0A918RYY7_9HYPH|nr:SIMPL domain-containing protein [Devosia pacifica]GHA16484.1 SIMPL domain-containing protein [Devosia pacifica]
MRFSRPLLSVALLASLALPATAATISVQGTGEVAAAPDMAQINSGVTTQAKTAREALDANNEAMEQLISALTGAGVERRDIQTSQFSVNPNYAYSDARDSSGYTQPPRIDSYQVSNTVTVIVRDLDELGAILDSSVDVGANTINGINFSVADPTDLYDEARRAAVEDARRKAQLYADAAGLELEELESITEGGNVSPPQPYAMARMDAVAESVPVETGELTFSISVSVSWDASED